MKRYYIKIFLSFLIVAFFLSCGGGGGGGSSAGSGGSSLVSVTVGGSGSSASLKIEKDTLYARAKIFFKKLMKTDEAIAAIPANVASIKFTISAPDMTAITRTVVLSGQTSITETFTIPNGTGRFFVVDAFDSSSVLLFSGNTTASITGTAVSLGINMAYVRVTVFISNYNSNTVSVIDPSTNAIIATIPVGANPVGVAVNPVTRLAYVANQTPATVSVIDIVTNTVVNTISLLTASPSGVAVDTANNKVYISNNNISNSVDVINAAAGNSVSSVTLISAANVLAVAASPGINRVYAKDAGNNLYMIDTTTDTLVGGPLAIFAGISPVGIAVNQLTNKVYLTWFTSTGTVYVVDGTSNTLITSVSVGMDPTGVGIHPTANKAYVANSSFNNVSVIDLATNSVITTMNVGSVPQGIAVDSVLNRAYVANRGTNNVSVIDTSTDTVVATVAVGNSPVGVATSR